MAISTVSLALHPPSETVHKYVPFAVTVVVFVVPPLLHKYESYPVGAVNVVEVPQAVTSEAKSMVGRMDKVIAILIVCVVAQSPASGVKV